jgi:hypothetical protein
VCKLDLAHSLFVENRFSCQKGFWLGRTLKEGLACFSPLRRTDFKETFLGGHFLASSLNALLILGQALRISSDCCFEKSLSFLQWRIGTSNKLKTPYLSFLAAF